MEVWAIYACILANTVWICILACAIDRLNRRMKRDRAERLKDATTFAHELDTLRKSHDIEREWTDFNRRLAEIDGKAASD
jgi:hypothetical protein